MQDTIQDEADYWYVRSVPGSTKQEKLLQFYKKDFRTSEEDWKTTGHFFIITIISRNPPKFAFKLGDYSDAIKNGRFIIDQID